MADEQSSYCSCIHFTSFEPLREISCVGLFTVTGAMHSVQFSQIIHSLRLTVIGSPWPKQLMFLLFISDYCYKYYPNVELEKAPGQSTSLHVVRLQVMCILRYLDSNGSLI